MKKGIVMPIAAKMIWNPKEKPMVARAALRLSMAGPYTFDLAGQAGRCYPPSGLTALNNLHRLRLFPSTDGFHPGGPHLLSCKTRSARPAGFAFHRRENCRSPRRAGGVICCIHD